MSAAVVFLFLASLFAPVTTGLDLGEQTQDLDEDLPGLPFGSDTPSLAYTDDHVDNRTAPHGARNITVIDARLFDDDPDSEMDRWDSFTWQNGTDATLPERLEAWELHFETSQPVDPEQGSGFIRVVQVREQLWELTEAPDGVGLTCEPDCTVAAATSFTLTGIDIESQNIHAEDAFNITLTFDVLLEEPGALQPVVPEDGITFSGPAPAGRTQEEGPAADFPGTELSIIGPADEFLWVCEETQWTAGGPEICKLSVFDSAGQIEEFYDATVGFTTSAGASPDGFAPLFDALDDGGVGFPAEYTFTPDDAGVRNFTITLFNAEDGATIRAEDDGTLTMGVGPFVNATTDPIDVTAASPASFLIGCEPDDSQARVVNSTIECGVVEDSWQDSYGNPSESGPATKNLTIEDDQGVDLDPDGTNTFELPTSIERTASASHDIARNASLFSLVPDALDTFLITCAPDPATVANEVLCEATDGEDEFGNPVVLANATWILEDSDGAQLDDDSGLDFGFETPTDVDDGPLTVKATASDSDNETADAATPLDLLPDQPAEFEVDCPVDSVAGVAFACDVTAFDEHGNQATQYEGTVSFSTNADASPNGDPPDLPAEYTFTLDDAGNSTVEGFVLYNAESGVDLTVQDTEDPSVAGTQQGIEIAPAAASALSFADQPPAQIPATVAWDTFSVQVVDAYGNLVDAETEITLTATPGATDTLEGTTTQTTEDGVATFNPIHYNTPETITVTAASDGLDSVESDEVEVTALFEIIIAPEAGVFAPGDIDALIDYRSIAITIDLAEEADLWVRVLEGDPDSGPTTVTKVIMNGAERGPGEVELAWDGRNQASQAVPEGPYTLEVEAGDPETGGTVTQVHGTAMTVDRTAPSFSVDVADPGVFNNATVVTLTITADEELHAEQAEIDGSVDQPGCGAAALTGFQRTNETIFTVDYTVRGPDQACTNGPVKVTISGRDLATLPGETELSDVFLVDFTSPEVPGLVLENVEAPDPDLANGTGEIDATIHVCAVYSIEGIGDPDACDDVDTATVGEDGEWGPVEVPREDGVGAVEVCASQEDLAGNLGERTCLGLDSIPPELTEIEFLNDPLRSEKTLVPGGPTGTDVTFLVDQDTWYTVEIRNATNDTVRNIPLEEECDVDDGECIADEFDPATFHWNGTDDAFNPLDDGLYTVCITARDMHHNSDTTCSEAAMELDNTPPTFEIVAWEVGDKLAAAKGDLVTLTIQSNETLTDAPTVSVGGEDADCTNSGSGSEFTCDYTSVGPSGTKPVLVEGRDLAGNDGESQLDDGPVVDVDAPEFIEFEIGLNPPGSNDTISGGIDENDPGLGIEGRELVLQLHGMSLSCAISEATKFGEPVDLTTTDADFGPLSVGDNLFPFVRATITDEAGNVGVSDCLNNDISPPGIIQIQESIRSQDPDDPGNFAELDVPPTPRIISPGADDDEDNPNPSPGVKNFYKIEFNLTEDALLTWEAFSGPDCSVEFDFGEAVTNQEFSAGDKELFFSGVLDGKNPPNGVFCLFLTAEDDAGNTRTVTRNVAVDNTVPVFSDFEITEMRNATGSPLSVHEDGVFYLNEGELDIRFCVDKTLDGAPGVAPDAGTFNESALEGPSGDRCYTSKIEIETGDAEDLHSFVVTGTDLAGNPNNAFDASLTDSASEEVLYQVDQTDPVLSDITDTGELLINAGGTVPLLATCSDASPVEVHAVIGGTAHAMSIVEGTNEYELDYTHKGTVGNAPDADTIGYHIECLDAAGNDANTTADGQEIEVSPGPLVTIDISPNPQPQIQVTATQPFTATGTDAFGNDVGLDSVTDCDWSTADSDLGSFEDNVLTAGTNTGVYNQGIQVECLGVSESLTILVTPGDTASVEVTYEQDGEPTSDPVDVAAGTSLGLTATPRDEFGNPVFDEETMLPSPTLAMGRNFVGKIGDGTTPWEEEPVDVLNIEDAVAISAGRDHNLAVMDDGSVMAWGWGSSGSLGLGESFSIRLEPTPVPGITNAVDVSASNSPHSLAVLDDGTVLAWGRNLNGELGLGFTSFSESSPTLVPGITNAVAVSAGTSFSLALLEDGTLLAWGRGDFGRLGLGDEENRLEPTPVPGVTGVSQVSAGSLYALAVMEDGSMMSWGRNDKGQLGLGDMQNRLSPEAIPGITNAVQASGGRDHSLVVLDNGTMMAWGGWSFGRLGTGTSNDQTEPLAIPGVTNAVQVSAQEKHSLALLDDGTMMSWGRGNEGRLGLGSTDNHNTPQVVPGLADVAHVETGQVHSLALLADGSVKAWGDNINGKLGDGNEHLRLEPVEVVGADAAVAVSASQSMSLALMEDGTMMVWGSGNSGRLGTGSFASQFEPVPIPDVSGVAGISAGGNHNLVVLDDGTILAWGLGSLGRLGLGHTTSRFVPTEVPGITNAIAVSAGSSHSLAALDNGTVMAWGSGRDGRLGLGDEENHDEPQFVPGITNAVSVAAGSTTSFALLENGTILAWGRGSFGRLGVGDSDDRWEPTPVVDITNAIQISAAANHAFALLEDGSIMGWGRNLDGRLATESSTHDGPKPVNDITDAVHVSATNGHSLAVLSNGSLMAWGSNNVGQLGLGDTENRNVPTLVPGVTNAVAADGGQRHSLVATGHFAADLVDWSIGSDPQGTLGDLSPMAGTDVSFTARDTPVSVESEGREVTACTPNGICGSVNITVAPGPLDQVVLENPDGDAASYDHVVDKTETYTATPLDAFGNDVSASCVFSTSTSDGGTLGSMDSATGDLRARTKTETVTFDGTGQVHADCDLDGVSRSASLDVTLLPDEPHHVHALLGMSEVTGVEVPSDEDLSFDAVVHDQFHNERADDRDSCTFSTDKGTIGASTGFFEPENLEAGDVANVTVECPDATLSTDVTVTIGPGGIRGVELELTENDEGLHNQPDDSKVRPGVEFELNATALDKDDQPIPEGEVEFSWTRTHQETGAVENLTETSALITPSANLTAGTYRYCVTATQENGGFSACEDLQVLAPQIDVHEPVSDFTETNAINPQGPSGDFVRIGFELDRDVEMTIEMMDNGEVARDLFLGIPQPFNEDEHEVEWDGTDDTNADFLPDGDYRVKVCVIDDNDNEACNDGRLVILDTVPPSFTLTHDGGPLPDVLGEGTLEMEIVSDEALHHEASDPEVRLDFADGSFQEPEAESDGDLRWTTGFTVEPASDGVAEINVTGEDRARNEGFKTHTFVVDTTDPNFVDLEDAYHVTAGEPGHIEVTASDATEVTAKFDFEGTTACEFGSELTNGTSNGEIEEVTLRCDLPTLTSVADDTTTFTVNLEDAAGNTNTSAQIDLIVLPGPLDQIGVHDDLGLDAQVSADDAEDGIVLTLQGEDEFGNAVSEPVSMEASLDTVPADEGGLLGVDCATGDKLDPEAGPEPTVTVQTDGDGQACVRLVLSTKADTTHDVDVTAEVDGETIIGESRTIVTIPGEPAEVLLDPLPSDLSADVADREAGEPAGSGLEVEATVLDQFENRVADGTDVDFAAEDHGEANSVGLPSDESCGTDDGECSVVFDLSTTAGDAYTFSASAGAASSEASDPVTIVPGAHHHTVVVPEDAGVVSADDTVQFDAVGHDQFDNAIDPGDLSQIPEWEIEETPDGRPEHDHEIDGTGMFEAGFKDGTFTVVGTIDGKSGEATITVRPMSITNVHADPETFYPLDQPGFKDTTRIHYTIDRQAHVWMNITELDGELVKAVLQGALREPGENSAVWDGTDLAAQFADPGTYRIEIEAQDTSMFETRDTHTDAEVTVAIDD